MLIWRWLVALVRSPLAREAAADAEQLARELVDKQMADTRPSPLPYLAVQHQQGQIKSAAHPAQRCNVPPPGWVCSRPAGHSGPCAATAQPPPCPPSLPPSAPPPAAELKRQ
jgi:hypothetical protein